MRPRSFALRSFAIPALLAAVAVTACSAPAGTDASSSASSAALDPCVPAPPPAAVPKPFVIDVGAAGPYALATTDDGAFVIVTIGDDDSVGSTIFSFADYAATSGSNLRPTSITDANDPFGERLYMIVDDGAHGAIFSVKVDGSDPRFDHTFTGGADGGKPIGKLATIGREELLGITSEGKGTIFVMNAADGIALKTTHTFAGGPGDGESPAFGLTIRGGQVWGVTTRGGANDRGTIFAIQDYGGQYQTLHAFDSDETPTSPIIDAQGLRGPGAGLRGIVYKDGAVVGGASTMYGLDWSGTGYALLNALPSPATGGTFSAATELATLTMHPEAYVCGADGLFRMTPDGVTITNVDDPSLGGAESCDDLVYVRDGLAVALVHGVGGLPKIIEIQEGTTH